MKAFNVSALTLLLSLFASSASAGLVFSIKEPYDLEASTVYAPDAPPFKVNNSNDMKARELKIDLSAGTFEASFGDGNRRNARITGTIDPETYELKGYIKGTENLSWESGGYRRSSYEGTIKGKLDDYKVKSLREQEASTEPYYPAVFYFEGETIIKFETFDYNLGIFGGPVTNVPQGGYAVGADYTSESMLTLRGEITGTGSVQTFNNPVPDEIRVTSVSGEDTEYSRDGGKTYQPLTTGTVLKAGDFVQTLDGHAVMDLGYGKLTVPQFTTFQINEYSSQAKLKKTQMHLYTGTVKVNVKHTAAIRSDFSVSTPTANSSIRGSEMIVSYDKNSDTTTVYTTDDKAYVQGTNDSSETTVPEGQKSVVVNGVAGAPIAFEASELPAFPVEGFDFSGFLMPLIVVVALGAAAFFFLKRKKQ